MQAHCSSGMCACDEVNLHGIYALGSNLGPPRMDGRAHGKRSLDALDERALHELLFGEHPSCLLRYVLLARRAMVHKETHT